jgi:hypothetical protein
MGERSTGATPSAFLHQIGDARGAEDRKEYHHENPDEAKLCHVHRLATLRYERRIARTLRA